MELTQINQLSIQKSIVIPEQSRLVPSRFNRWSPETLAPWTYLKSYDDLTPELKLRYNQLHALSINELFIWFEERLLLPILTRMINNRNYSSEFRIACQNFYNEEVKHSEMFWRLSKAAAPEFYSNSKFYFLNYNLNFGKWLLEQSLKFPQLLGLWCWILILFEERTLMFSREFLKAKDDVDPSFALIHQLHMVEEARHVQMDEHFIDEIYKHSTLLTRRMTAFLFKFVLKSFSSPRYMSLAIAEQLKREFVRPLEQELIEQVVSELPGLKSNEKFLNQFFGKQATGETQFILKEYPEFSSLHTYFRN